jgi:hypothetical protein
VRSFDCTFVPSDEPRLLLRNPFLRQHSDPTGPATESPKSRETLVLYRRRAFAKESRWAGRSGARSIKP